MNRWKSDFALLLSSHTIRTPVHNIIKGLDVKRSTSWLSRNIYSRNVQGNKTAHALTRGKNEKLTFMLSSTDFITCTNKCKTLLLANYAFEYSAYRIEQVFHWVKIQFRSNLNTALSASWFNQVYSRIVMNKLCNLNMKLTSHQSVYQFIQVDRRNESSKNNQSI